jgi:hypothetical protein
MDLMGWTWFDPDVLYLLWHSPGAYEGYHTPELDELLEATRTTCRPDERERSSEAFEILLKRPCTCRSTPRLALDVRGLRRGAGLQGRAVQPRAVQRDEA